MPVDPVDIMREEYKRLSDEVGKSLTNRFTVLGFGLAAVGVLLGFAVKGFENSQIELPAVALGLMVPGTCFLTLFVWASEVRRGRRASWYLWGLERRINGEMKQRLLRWEEDIRKPAHPLLVLFRGHYYVIVAFFATVGTASAVFGARALRWDWCCVILWAGLMLALIVVPLTPYLRRLADFDNPDSTWPPPL
jgi:hypothetical protein